GGGRYSAGPYAGPTPVAPVGDVLARRSGRAGGASLGSLRLCAQRIRAVRAFDYRMSHGAQALAGSSAAGPGSIYYTAAPGAASDRHALRSVPAYAAAVDEAENLRGYEMSLLCGIDIGTSATKV